MGGVGALGGAFDQPAENGWNLVEVGGLVQEVVRARGHAFVLILRIWVVRANQHLQPGMPLPDRLKHIQARPSGHLQVQDNRIRIRSFDGRHRIRYVSSFPDHLDTRNVFQQVMEPLNNKLGIIRNKDTHLLSPRGLPVHIIDNDKFTEKNIG